MVGTWCCLNRPWMLRHVASAIDFLAAAPPTPSRLYALWCTIDRWCNCQVSTSCILGLFGLFCNSHSANQFCTGIDKISWWHWSKSQVRTVHGLVLKLLQGSVTPIDSIVTAATALVSGVTTHSSVYFRKCARSQRSTVEIQHSQRSKPENQRAWSMVKTLK